MKKLVLAVVLVLGVIGFTSLSSNSVEAAIPASKFKEASPVINEIPTRHSLPIVTPFEIPTRH
ncbi:hypothetical protein [Cytobacillus horneckiae]|uniref:hypothetical protein n=1 Tax=Cytobacillus horneckiae TaxID=549687 RepID=UPI0019D19A79|nr:hypothetical protein [Cytobacillus horneckiae]MBN6885865.1 hypothetical protein [Cytobacillus horneckiae]MCM3177409.1 hypothetical protein [Cytobacillus horneckiae]